MVVLSDLPAELLLNVLKDLSLRDLGALSRTSHALNETIKANAETIYRTAAVLHRFARPTGLLEDIAWQVYPPGRDVRCSWRDFCYRRTLLERSWNTGSSVAGLGSLDFSKGTERVAGRVHHFGVDQEHHTLLVLISSMVMVYAINSMEVLCTLQVPSRAIRRFWCSGQYLVVLCDPQRESTETVAQSASICIYKRSPLSSRNTPLRGHYTLHLSYNLPDGRIHWTNGCEAIQGSCFAELVYHSERGVEVLVFDLELGRIVHLLSLADMRRGTWAPQDIQQELSVALSDTHVCVCFVQYVLIIPLGGEILQDNEGSRQEPAVIFPSQDMARETGIVMRRNALQMTLEPHRGIYGREKAWGVNFAARGYSRIGGSGLAINDMLHPMRVSPSREVTEATTESHALVLWGVGQITQQRFNDACFSPSGRHLALINEFGVLYLVEDFNRVSQGLASWSEITTRIAFPYSSKSLMWVYEMRLILRTAHELFIINLDPDFHGLAHGTPSSARGSMPSFPRLRVHRVDQVYEGREGITEQLHVTRSAFWVLRKESNIRHIQGAVEESVHDERRVFVTDLSGL